jgi:hypothetical protein
VKETTKINSLQNIQDGFENVPVVKNFNDIHHEVKESKTTIKESAKMIKSETSQQILGGIRSEGTKIKNKLETSSGIPLTEIQDKFTKVGRLMKDSAARFEKRNRVTEITIVLMIMVALFYDLLQFLLDLIPFVGWILSGLIGIFSWLTFYTWTSIKGWGMSDSIKKIIVSKILPAIGCVGVLNIGPEITAGVIFTILIVKGEDVLYNKSKGRLDKEVLIEGSKTLNYLKKLV